jgi:pimeloyl-ACP methyl ester carboxylesterase
MAKALPPGEIVTKAGTFVANVLPDPFDERDLEYRPRLQPLPTVLDQRKGKIVLHQKGNSCVGHALAAMINTVLASTPDAQPPLPRVSPYMLYWLARRYDEFEGEEDLGSSLRGGLNGWFYHGCALETKWRGLRTVRDLDDPAFREHCSERPLGAFYRVNPFRLDDMQSAINELSVIVASAAIHEGWQEPVLMQKAGKEPVYTIVRPDQPTAIGGHAFALVGYNEVGFLVQNSWGKNWGKGGFATLTYEDWLDSAYDAWVARPGVPRTPFASGRNRAASASGGKLATGPAPNLELLKKFVVNLGNNGRLSRTGNFISTPVQLESLFANMAAQHRAWEQSGDTARHVVLYAHGGLNPEMGGLTTAQKHLGWWLTNHVYPLSFVWETGPGETVVDQVADLVKDKLPFGAVGFDLAERADRFVEKIARKVAWAWDEMKENASRASEPLTAGAAQWPPDGAAEKMAREPGASLAVDRLARYIRDVRAQGGSVSVHLIGHSAGAIFHAALLDRLRQAGIQVETLALCAPAIRIDEFEKKLLPHLGSRVKSTSLFALSDARELDDWLNVGPLRFYFKSLLYLIARALEPESGKSRFEVPLLGMAKYLTGGLRQKIEAAGGDLVIAPSEKAADSGCSAAHHGQFDDDPPTMTSILLRILGRTTAVDKNVFKPFMEAAEPVGAVPVGPPPAATAPEAQQLLRAAAAAAPGEAPPVEVASPVPAIPAKSRILGKMMDTGWQPAASTGASGADDGTS